jgi:hypothetical protein
MCPDYDRVPVSFSELFLSAVEPPVVEEETTDAAVAEVA